MNVEQIAAGICLLKMAAVFVAVLVVGIAVAKKTLGEGYD